jgi:hypothetical protein
MTGPHIPMTTSAGHFLSMQPAQGSEPQAMTWFRGDEVSRLSDERTKYREAIAAVLAIFSDPKESGDSDTQLKILDIVERALK